MNRIGQNVSAGIENLLPDVGEWPRARFLTLAEQPTPAAAEILAANLRGACQIVLRLREALTAPDQVQAGGR